MNVLRKIFSRQVLAVLGVIALCLLIWFAGDLIWIGRFHPMEPEWVRAVLVLAVILYFVGKWAWRRLEAKRANAQLTEGLVAEGRKAEALEPAGASEVALLRTRFEEAITLLRQTKQKKAGRLAAFGNQFLYELPWYMFIGAPGAGKTTALVNSGLRFPLSERFGHEAISGVGGTRNCDWWFTDEAVLLDTAGRYVTQESDRDADSAAWAGFLKLLSKYRPRRPINGVLVTISVADLLQQSPAQLEVHAQAIRKRIQELHEQLNVRFPIYVLVSKADLLPGFMEFFSEYGREERAQVWGTTFPLAEKETNVLERFNVQFSALEKRLNDRLLDRLEQEPDLQRRALLYAFPQHFSALREPLTQILTRVFAPSRFEAQPLVRGVYFTSGTQEGTPIDRIIGSLARALRLERKMTGPQRPSGKSFFITRLFKDVIFAEAELAGANLRWERQRGLIQWAAFSVAAVLTISLLLAWAVSFSRNKAYVADVEANAKRVSEEVSALPAQRSADVLEVLPVLSNVRDIASPPRTESGRVPWSMQYGLYQGDDLNDAARQAYRGMLQDVLLPRLALRIEHQLRSRAQQNPDMLYEALKAYLIVSDSKRFKAGALHDYVRSGSVAGGTTAEQQATELAAHLDALVTIEPRILPHQPDPKLIEAARDAIANTSTAQRIYERVKQSAALAKLEEFTAVKAGGSTAMRVFRSASGKPPTRGVPGFYTREGYKFFLSAAEPVSKQLAEEEPWVLGLRASETGRASDTHAKERLLNEARRLYLHHYRDVWANFVRDVQLIGAANLKESVALAGTLSGPDSPFPPLMRAIVAEVTLGKSEEQQKGERSVAGSVVKYAQEKGAAWIGKPPPGSPAAPPESIVDDHFADLRRFVLAPPGQTSPLDAAMKLMKAIHDYLASVQAAIASRSPLPSPEIAAKLRSEAGFMPESVQAMVNSLTTGAGRQMLKESRSGWSGELAPIAEFCRKAIDGRYPFVRTSSVDVTQKDFSDLFAPDGLLDKFFKTNLARNVDTDSKPWRFRNPEDGSRGDASAALIEFQRAKAIRDVFFGNRDTPVIAVTFRPLKLDPGLAHFTLDVDGQVLKYTPASQTPMTMRWPGPNGTNQIRITAASATGSATGGQVFEGPWALFRMFDRAQVEPTSQPEKLLVTFNIEGRRALFEVLSSSVHNPLRLGDLERFRCPGRV